MDLDGRNVTVIGAGIGGLVAAVALARRGARVHVLERADTVREVGAGLQVSPNGGAVLDALGLGPGLEQIGLRAGAVELRDYRAGAKVLRLELGRQGGAYRFVHRADLVAMLAEAARGAGARLCLLHNVTRIDDETGADGRVRVTTEKGAQIRSDLVIGADGLHSVARRRLNGEHAPFFTGQVAWRAVVPAPAGAPPRATVYMGPGRHMVTYPLRGGAEMNIVAVEERREWAEEGWSHRDDPGNLRRAFAGFCPAARALLERVERCYLWGLFRHPVAPAWHRGRVAILGDAAHPTLPFLAQGAVMAMEDAWVLADSLARHDATEAALAAYQARRERRVRRVVDAATRNARNYHLRNPLLRGAAHGALRVAGTAAPGLVLGRFDWLYGHDVTKD